MGYPRAEDHRGVTSQDAERRTRREGHSQTGNGRGRERSGQGNKDSEGYLPTGDQRERNKSGHGKKATELGALTV